MPLYYKRFAEICPSPSVRLWGSGVYGVSSTDGRCTRRDTGVSVQRNPATHHGVASETYPTKD